jgi:tetratricopeptide (TPR) repeat protein
LTIAKECNDQIGQRRAHINLGNAYLYLEDFDKALDHYRYLRFILNKRNKTDFFCLLE